MFVVGVLCLGKNKAIIADNPIRMQDITKHAANPQTWNTQPDITVPSRRPMAFAI